MSWCVPIRGSAGQSLPAVHVLGTGGTIGSGGDYWQGNATRVPIEQLVQIPGIEKVATVTTEQLWNVASSAIGPARWLELRPPISSTSPSRITAR
ncbi:MAG: asparaginase [Gemmatimonadetes bacterium]|nr:asparaginase [Gemmatimonadota bacterium]